jgi:hypothetical protein
MAAQGKEGRSVHAEQFVSVSRYRAILNVGISVFHWEGLLANVHNHQRSLGIPWPRVPVCMIARE